jgi:hypothetical protein
MTRIGLWLACGALALAFGCGGRGSSTPDGGVIVLRDSGTPPAQDAGTPPPPRDAGAPRVDSGSGSSCASSADFQTCAQCFCGENMAGCQSYIEALIGNIYCGPTCSSDCAPVCADPNADAPAACDTCVGGLTETSADVMGFQSACGSNASCVNFATSLQMCPG